MTLTNNELKKAVRLALYAGTTAIVGLSTMPVFAQDNEQGSERLETIVVTGSRIRRVDVESASPVFSIEKADIQKSGKLTIGDLIQESPAISGAATNPSVNNGGGSGASTISLRGLGSQRTLLLVDGRRLAYSDVNSIPINMVERIDILKDGASAIYGSDAIGGVVNFILSKNYQGISASVDYGISDRDDGTRKGFQMNIGHTSDRGSLNIGMTYNKQDAISAGDRKFSNPSLYNYYGTVIPLGSGSIPDGRFVIPRTAAAAVGINCPGTGSTVSVTRVHGAEGTNASQFRCYVGGGNPNDTFNYSPYNLELTPSERAGLFVNGNYRITDTIEAYLTAFTNKTRSKYVIAPLPLIVAQLGAPISAQSVYNPFGVNIRSGGIRDLSGGNREGSYETQADQFSSGLRGSFGDTWQWDAGVTWARTSQDRGNTGYYYLPAFADAIGPSFFDVNGVARCGTPTTPIAGCVPLNLFNFDTSTAAGALTRSQLDALQLTVRSHNYSTQKSAQFNVTGEIFNLPAGAVGLAVGGEYRKDYQYFQPDFVSTITDPNQGSCLTFTDACGSPSKGQLSVREFYGELFVPILADLPFAKSLNLTLGSRYSDYSAFGTTTNSKIGFEYRPIDDLMLRGTVAEVFRSPTISDLYGGTTPSADTYADPCDNLVAGDPRLSNPACAGLGAGFEQVTVQTQALYGANANVKPENGRTYTWGAVYDPSWLPGLSTSLDFWKVKLTNTIGAIGTQVIIDQCFTFGRFCNLFTRQLGAGGNGDIAFVSNLTQNIGRVDTNGVDFSIKYRLPETAFGNFNVSLDTTYVGKYDTEVIAGDITTRYHRAGTYTSSAGGGDGNYARWRGLGALNWNMGAFDAGWRMRYVGATRFGVYDSAGDGSQVVAPGGDPLNNSFRTGGVTYHNLTAGFNAEAINTRFEVGVDNVFDKQPPILWQYGFNGNTDERTYDTAGRYYWARVGVKF